jgi:ribosomal peptide maturation radical SAM protein 1
MDVAFAVVPFADIARPAIGVSLLKAEVARRGFSSRIHYFNIDFAATIGDDLYTYISDQTPSDSMAGEWYFADQVFPGQLPPEHEYVRNVLSRVSPPEMLRQLLQSRSKRAEFIDRCARALHATGAPIVAFTTTFHQTCACLAIAKRLKTMPNPPVICFGGANCEGEMGLQILRSFPWVDYVCTREGDVVFPEFVEGYVKEGKTSGLSGFLHRDESSELTYPAMIEDMDSLPFPDYDDYVDTLKASSLDGKIKREIQIEAARGCWWGAKHHCTFCGLNGDTMPYRSKSPDRVYRELKHLYQRYGYKRIDSVDNILDHRYLTSVFPRLVAEGIELEMFYEVKANLKYSQLATMKRGGITMIQPGIESFSTQVLNLMKKGVNGAQNVQLLKWAEEIGIMPAWNVLAGFPGEPPSEYDRMAELIPLLTHLEPPTGCAQIRLDRFSPLFNKAGDSGIVRVRPTLAYYYVFPLGRRELARLAYFFDFDYQDGRQPENYIRRVQNEITKWRNARFQADVSRRPRLDAKLHKDGTVHVSDSRDCAVAGEHWLAGLPAQVLVACDTAQSRPTLERRFAPEYPPDAVGEALQELLDARVVAPIDNFFLSLPVIRNRTPQTAETERDADRPITTTANPEPLLRIL